MNEKIHEETFTFEYVFNCKKCGKMLKSASWKQLEQNVLYHVNAKEKGRGIDRKEFKKRIYELKKEEEVIEGQV